MRRRLYAQVIGMMVVVIAAATSAAVAQPRARVAVVPLKNQSEWWGWQLGRTAAGQLVVELTTRGVFTMVERELTPALLDEIYLGQTGAVNPATAAKMGKLLGVDYFVTGEVLSFVVRERNVGIPPLRYRDWRVETEVTLRAINTSTGEIVAATRAKGEESFGRGGQFGSTTLSENSRQMAFSSSLAEKALGPAVKKLADGLVDQRERFVPNVAPVPPAQFVGSSKDGLHYIDHGKQTGVTVGKRYLVLRVVDTIRDKAGKVLDQVTKQVGIVEVVQVLERSSVVRLVEGAIGKGDRLEAAGG